MWKSRCGRRRSSVKRTITPFLWFDRNAEEAMNFQEVDDYWAELTGGGGRDDRCGWLKDKYGVSWQIVPSLLPKLLGDTDPEKRNRVMKTMLQMVKLDIARLQQAYEGR